MITFTKLLIGQIKYFLFKLNISIYQCFRTIHVNKLNSTSQQRKLFKQETLPSLLITGFVQTNQHYQITRTNDREIFLGHTHMTNLVCCDLTSNNEGLIN